MKIELSWGSLRRSLVGSRGPFLWVVGAVAAVTAAVLGVQDVLNLEGPGWSQILVAFLIILLLVSLATIVVQDRWRSRNTRYALAAPSIHDSFHHLRDLTASMSRGASVEDFGPHLRFALTSFAKAFSIIAGADCRAAVKFIYNDNGSLSAITPDTASLRALKVRTLDRDAGSLVSDAARDESSDWVTENTDYERLILNAGKDRYFLSNDLRKESPYKNSHWRADERRDYLSTIVWPIQRSDHDVRPLALNIEGFLTVDTLATRVFRRRFDFEVGAAFADTLYGVLRVWREIASDPHPPASQDAASEAISGPDEINLRTNPMEVTK